jgi:phosphoserine phosphatase
VAGQGPSGPFPGNPGQSDDFAGFRERHGRVFMEVGLFLDVDGVLNHKAVNLQFAQLLGVENKLIELEKRFANREITNDEFNAEFIPLFRDAKFTKEFAQKNYFNIQMRANAKQLIASCPNTFLVTSGPSYFIDMLVKENNLRDDRILCSRYQFDQEDLLSRDVRPVNSAMKGDFVSAYAPRFDVSIGVGDTEQDIEFLSHCDVRILMAGNRLEYLNVRELQPIIDLIGKFQTASRFPEQRYEAALTRLYAESDYRKNVFIMTPFRNEARYRETISAIRETLAKVGLRGWTADERNFEQQLWDNIQVYLNGCRAGIAVFTDDTTAHPQSDQRAAFNPNVSIEVGHMLSRKKPVLLLKEKNLPRLPSDIVGSLYSDFDLNNSADSIRQAVDKWVKEHVL